MSLKNKLKHVTAASSSKWVEEAKVKVANKGARRKARMVALEVLRILKERDMNQTDLAAIMGVSRQQVTKIVKGQENLTLETIDKLEMAFGAEFVHIGRQDEDSANDYSAIFESHLPKQLIKPFSLIQFEFFQRTSDPIPMWNQYASFDVFQGAICRNHSLREVTDVPYKKNVPPGLGVAQFYFEEC